MLKAKTTNVIAFSRLSLALLNNAETHLLSSTKNTFLQTITEAKAIAIASQTLYQPHTTSNVPPTSEHNDHSSFLQAYFHHLLFSV